MTLSRKGAATLQWHVQEHLSPLFAVFLHSLSVYSPEISLLYWSLQLLSPVAVTKANFSRIVLHLRYQRDVSAKAGPGHRCFEGNNHVKP